MQNAQPTTNCATWILKVDYLSISKQQKNFGVSKMQGGVTIGHMATRLLIRSWNVCWCAPEINTNYFKKLIMFMK